VSDHRLRCSVSSTSLLSLFLVLSTAGARVQFAADQLTAGGGGGVFEHLVIDVRTGRLYVGATNRLYQLDGERLAVEAAVTTGPRPDNPLCPPPPSADCHDAARQPTDAVTKALALDPHDDRLIVCTNLFQVCTATTTVARQPSG